MNFPNEFPQTPTPGLAEGGSLRSTSAPTQYLSGQLLLTDSMAPCADSFVFHTTPPRKFKATGGASTPKVSPPLPAHPGFGVCYSLEPRGVRGDAAFQSSLRGGSRVTAAPSGVT